MKNKIEGVHYIDAVYKLNKHSPQFVCKRHVRDTPFTSVC